MGWTFFHKPVGKKAVDAIREDSLGAEWCAKHLVAMTATREAVFIVAKFHEPDSEVYVPDADGFVRSLGVYAIKSAPRSDYNFGYKDMTETMGPYGCEAPLSILAQCSELKPLPADAPEYSSLRSATEYRARSVKAAATKALKRSLKPGNKVRLVEPLSFAGEMLQDFTVAVTRVRGRQGKSTIFYAANGMACAISARQLEGATIA